MKLELRAWLWAIAIETVLASASGWAMYKGGIEPGGAIFVLLHLPSSVIFGFLGSVIVGDFIELEYALMLLTVIFQAALIRFVVKRFFQE